jgi:23S rRNA (cytosine1962-C5)-methyltransferase
LILPTNGWGFAATAGKFTSSAILNLMFTPEMYQLLDFGDGRRLERFGTLCLDRPCPGAESVVPAAPNRWAEADARFVRTDAQEGHWVEQHALPERWTIRHGAVTFELKRTEFGHLGVFPEQAACWDWIAEQVAQLRQGDEPFRMLNLFAYTGGSTLAAAAAGAEVTHVDSARNVVAWARRNAELSGLAESPVRWIAEDAVKYVERERKRGRQYDAVILDPPSYGHGPKGEVWRLDKDLPKLLVMCGELMATRPRFLLLTCHTPEFGPERLAKMLEETLRYGDAGAFAASQLALPAATGRTLPSGVLVRWAAKK